MIDDILNAIKGTFQADTNLASVTTYHLIDGMIPGMKPTISIGCYEVKYSDYDSDQDEVNASIRIWLYFHHMKPEDAEKLVRQLTQQIRYSLLGNMYLGGLVDASTVKSITFETEQVNQTQTLYYAMVDYEVKYYEPRQRPDGLTPPTLDYLDADFNNESIEMTYE